jgi:hypothetical protein
MRLTNVLQQVVRMVRDTGASSPTSSGRAQDHQRDESSMADFVRLLGDHDNNNSPSKN